MFDAVMGRAQGNTRRFGTGTIISIALHGGLLAGALWLSSGGKTDPQPKPTMPPLVVLGAQPRAQSAPVKSPSPPVRHKEHHAIAQPKRIDEMPVQNKLPENDKVASANPETNAQSKNTGDAPEGPGKGPIGPPVVSAPVGPTVIDFGPGMTRPVQLEAPAPAYTPDALRARVEGSIIAKCVITVDGTLENCRILKPLPFMEQSVLSALATWRYKPVTYEGRAVPVDYVFNIRLMLPGH